MQQFEYAKALFELASDNNEMLSEFQAFNEILDIEGLIDVLLTPNVSKPKKRAILDNVLDSFQVTFKHFIYVIIDNDRINIIKEIYNEYYKMVCKDNGIEIIDIYSACEIEDSLEESIKNKLEIKLRKKVVINKHINSNLIGGIRIECDGKCIDDSVLNQFVKIKSLL